MQLGDSLQRCFILYVFSEKSLDYMAPVYPTLVAVDITRIKGPETDLGHTFTTTKHHRRNELVMARMYGLEMLRHNTSGQPSNVVEVHEINILYPLNAHVGALFGSGPEFRETTEDDIPTDKGNFNIGLYVD